MPASLAGLKHLVAECGVTFKAIVRMALEKVRLRPYRFKHPLIAGKGRRPCNLTNAEIEDIFAREDFKGWD